MLSTSAQQLKEMGASLGLEGQDLVTFIREQQKLEREDRDKERDRQREEKEREAAEKEKERAFVREESERKIKLLQAEEEAKERQSQRELEKAKQAFEQELERSKHASEQRQEEERERHRSDLEKYERQMQAREKGYMFPPSQIQFGVSHRETGDEAADLTQMQEEYAQVANMSGTSMDNAGPPSFGRGIGKAPKMPYFDEEHDFMDSYLGRFERFATCQRWNRADWALYLSALLKGRALDVYSMLPADQANNYDQLKAALLKGYQLSADGFKRRFRTAKPESGETPTQFLTRIGNYLQRWIELANAEKSFDGLKTLMVQEQYLSICPKKMAMHLKEGKPKSIQELGEKAEIYVEAHATDVAFGTDPKPSNIRSLRTRGPQCRICRAFGHMHRQCPNSLSPRGIRKNANAAASRSFQPRQYGQPQQQSRPVKQTQQSGSGIRCYTCGKPGHFARDCFEKPKPTAAMIREKEKELEEMYAQYDEAKYENNEPLETEETEVKAAACQPVVSKPIAKPRPHTERRTPPLTCRQHNRSDCPQCNIIPTPTHHCQALIAVCQECGLHHPVIADACQSQDKIHQMPVVDGTVEGEPVSVLRDTGCSTVVVRRSLVSDEKLTGLEERCVLIDGTIRRTPVARIEIATPYFSGTVLAVCMKNPLYDLIVGNIPGAGNPQVPQQETQAVQTRSQAKAKPTKGLTPLITPSIDLGSEDIVKLQEEDKTLCRAMEAAKQKGDPQFQIVDKFLYRVKANRRGLTRKQLAVPEILRQRVMTLAHAGVMSGHQGIHRTHERVVASFWWPGISGDITRFCHSCDICQRTISKGRVPKVPLGKMPVIETPFKRVAVDLIGELIPASSRGHRYILTVVDYATCYPEAIALKSISSIVVAEALVSIFSRVGIPEEILSDQGTQFTGGLMKEVGRLLSMKQLTTTPYHLQCNGLVERFNGTLKTMLRRMCAEKPKDWDRYLDALLFAYREAPQESLGFAPFELLYGRSVNGPLQILRQLWTKEQSDPDVRTTYQYVVDLRNRLQETWDLAHEELRRKQVTQKRQFDYRAKPRSFTAGDQVLVLLPTSDNKLLMQWKGPFEVLERIEGNDYRIQLANRKKVLHANLLKQYISDVVEEDKASGESEGQMIAAAILEPEEDFLDQGPELETLNPLQKETVKDVKINPELSEEQQTEIKGLLEEYQDIFTDVPSITNQSEHRIKLTTDEPIKGKAYSLPHAMRETLDKKIDSMLAMGVIEESTAAYASPVVMVKKPDGSTRVCIDYRRLNSATIFNPEPMPTAEEIFAKLAGDQYFSKFDFSKGYW